MNRDPDLIPSSPSNSSLSSSDLDTESTGSFFHDRSTTLGTLMGVSFREIAVRPARVPSRRDHGHVDGVDVGGGGEGGGRRPKQRGAPEKRRRRHRGGRSWWRLCRDDMVRPTSLGEFLQVERQLGGAAGGEVADGHFLYGGGEGVAEHEAVGGGPLFEDGRVLPPADGRRRQQQQQRATEGAVSLGRLPVLLTGICSSGDG
ncbi:uncharacterized protein At3g17950-like [Phoenix dactylifera]|uniref:Uncharacterized protein At3g17950-like n=1 Tax=Phoenix dactylifera TaxID=42345 RepID=A0A8B8JCI0_PHODC|nr:uncharacterized protein At3g17950-like [Phoenix dactylifera]